MDLRAPRARRRAGRGVRAAGGHDIRPLILAFLLLVPTVAHAQGLTEAHVSLTLVESRNPLTGVVRTNMSAVYTEDPYVPATRITVGIGDLEVIDLTKRRGTLVTHWGRTEAGFRLPHDQISIVVWGGDLLQPVRLLAACCAVCRRVGPKTQCALEARAE